MFGGPFRRSVGSLPALAVATFGLCVTGCAPDEGYVLRTEQGIALELTPNHVTWVRLSEISETIDLVTEVYSAQRGWQQSDVMAVYGANPVVVHLRDAPYDCGKGPPCYGDYRAPDIVRAVVTQDRPICSSSLIHEFVHLLAHHLEGDSDTYHQDPGLFDTAESVTLRALQRCDF